MYLRVSRGAREGARGGRRMREENKAGIEKRIIINLPCCIVCRVQTVNSGNKKNLRSFP